MPLIRTALSLLGGVAIALGIPSAAALIMYSGDFRAIIPTLLYWPTIITDKVGLTADCSNANAISGKMTCVHASLAIVAILYPATIVVISLFLSRIMAQHEPRLDARGF